MQPSEVGTRLLLARQLCEAGGERLSARELSLLAGLSSAMVGHLESGRISSPGADTLVALADVLGVSVEWLAAGRGEEPTVEGVRASLARARAAVARQHRSVEAHVCDLSAELGDVAREARVALADGRLDDDERVTLRRELRQLIEAAEASLRDLDPAVPPAV